MAESTLEAGIIAYQQGETTKAIGIFSKILKQDPNNADAWFWLGRCQEDTERAKFCFERSAYLNQDLTSREYINVDTDDIPQAAKSGFAEFTNKVEISETSYSSQPPAPIPAVPAGIMQEREINPFLASPLPEGFVYPHNRHNKLELVLAALLGFLVIALVFALVIRFM